MVPGGWGEELETVAQDGVYSPDDEASTQLSCVHNMSGVHKSVWRERVKTG